MANSREKTAPKMSNALLFTRRQQTLLAESDESQPQEERKKRRSPIPREWALGEKYLVEIESLAKRLERAISNQNLGEAHMYQNMIDARLGRLSQKEIATFFGGNPSDFYGGEEE